MPVVSATVYEYLVAPWAIHLSITSVLSNHRRMPSSASTSKVTARVGSEDLARPPHAEVAGWDPGQRRDVGPVVVDGAVDARDGRAGQVGGRIIDAVSPP